MDIDIKSKTNEELTNLLLTVDGQGVKVKKQALQELLDRVKKESYKHGFESGEPREHENSQKI